METSSGGNSTIVVRRERMKIENPFAFKVGQVFTGFGIGCGIGIGVGRPLNLGAIPVLNQVMSATRGATDAFSGVSSHVNSSLRKLGAKNIEAGVGCGVGIGHGFGVGLALKPGVVHQIQSCTVQSVTKMMMKFGITPNLPLDQGLIPASLQGGMISSNQNPVGNIMQLATTAPEHATQGLTRDGNSSSDSSSFTSNKPPGDPSYGSRTEKVISDFLQNPILKRDNEPNELVLKHQQVIEELMKENEKLRQILVEDLKIPPSKLEASYSNSRSPCADCFECRRRRRKK
ncbi:uncharacterized protein LOC127787292 isoform X2 [Diospyros lotus]|uniref:uncharacterized protein LOC127787292 isoform X2 n=1 Tax=Diospyros lotus TaxID=55363 RepID=UPI00225A4B99|nr:uncharacterized protein LOC127787292 isoform X2 [Diospyros lotus]